MSIRLDPRRVGTLKQLAAEAGVRPGDLVRHWVEERIDAARQGLTPPAMADLAGTLAALAERVAALEVAAGTAPARTPIAEAPPAAATPPAPETSDESPAAEAAAAAPAPPAARAAEGTTKKGKRVAARPASHRVPLHEEMIAVLAERGPLSAAELAAAVSERGRYAPPRSGKPIDAAMVSQRASNPTYRPRFTRKAGRIGLAAPAG